MQVRQERTWTRQLWRRARQMFFSVQFRSNCCATLCSWPLGRRARPTELSLCLLSMHLSHLARGPAPCLLRVCWYARVGTSGDTSRGGWLAVIGHARLLGRR